MGRAGVVVNVFFRGIGVGLYTALAGKGGWVVVVGARGCGGGGNEDGRMKMGGGRSSSRLVTAFLEAICPT